MTIIPCCWVYMFQLLLNRITENHNKPTTGPTHPFICCDRSLGDFFCSHCGPTIAVPVIMIVSIRPVSPHLKCPNDILHLTRRAVPFNDEQIYPRIHDHFIPGNSSLDSDSRRETKILVDGRLWWAVGYGADRPDKCASLSPLDG